MGKWIREHRLLSYFLLAFLWSWAWWVSLVFTTTPQMFASGALPPTFFVCALMGGFGPSIAGIVIARVAGEFSLLSAGLKNTRFGGRWYAVVLLCVPVLTGVQALAQIASGRQIVYNVAPVMLVMGFIWPLFAALGEEIGWRGFALPKMLEKYGALKASLLLGLVWGLWHLPSDYIAYSNYGLLYLPLFLLTGPITLTAHAIIMTYLYQKTKGSVFAMILYHYTITMSGILAPGYAFASPADDIAKTAVSVAVLVVAAALLAIFSKEFRKEQTV